MERLEQAIYNTPLNNIMDGRGRDGNDQIQRDAIDSNPCL